MNDITLVNHLSTLAEPQSQPAAKASGGGSFLDTLKDAVGKTNQAQLAADQATRDLSTGKSSNIHQAMVAVEEADISMRLLVQMRNKVMDAYETIMRMQV